MEILLAFSLAIACRVLVQSLGYHMSGFLLLVVRFQTQFLLPLLYRRLLLRPRAPAEGRNQGREEDREKEKNVIHPRPKPNNPTQTPSLTHTHATPLSSSYVSSTFTLCTPPSLFLQILLSCSISLSFMVEVFSYLSFPSSLWLALYVYSDYSFRRRMRAAGAALAVEGDMKSLEGTLAVIEGAQVAAVREEGEKGEVGWRVLVYVCA